MKLTRTDQTVAPSQTSLPTQTTQQSGGAKQTPVKQGRELSDELVQSLPRQGGSESGQTKLPPPVQQKPPAKDKVVDLTPEELKSVAGIGGRGIRGHGTVEGEVTVIKGKAYLITAAKGSKSEVKFALDLPVGTARDLMGQRVRIEGTIDKTSPWGGSIKGATMVDGVHGVFPRGSYQQLSGTIAEKHIMGIGGEAPPSGTWLVLDNPVKVGDLTVSEVFVGKDLPNGSQVTLNGRLDVKTYGGVEVRPARPFVSLTGVSNITAGEPRFDGEKFYNASGTELRVLSIVRREMMDAPDLIMVLDPTADKAFVGSRGGFLPPEMNRFHGFRGAAPIGEPSDADRTSVRFDEAGNAFKGGKKLQLVGTEVPPPGTADMFSHAWYYDESSKTVFGFVSGGIAGFMNRMDSVTKMP